MNAYGGYVKQIVVQPKIDKLREAGLTVNDLARVVGENVENTGGGIVNSGDEQLVIRGVGRVVSPQEIAELPVKLRLRERSREDVAKFISPRSSYRRCDRQRAELGLRA